VIFAFHGGGHAGRVMATTWDKHTEQGMVLVAPSAMKDPALPGCRGHWRTIDRDFPDWSDFTTVDPCGTPRGHDLALVDAISQHLIDEGIVPQGFYAAGFSNGANFVNQLFITEKFAAAFDGFAAVGASISDHMQAATDPAVVGAGPLQPNHHQIDPALPGGEIRKPILLVRGTNEKGFIPWDNVIDSVDNGGCAVTSALDVVACYLDHETFPPLGKHSVISTAKETVDWYVDHNNSDERGVESLYPDLGHGSSFADHEDATMAVRQDFQRRPGDEDSATVARITIIDGFHQWPGKDGNAPTCESDNNCDIDMTEVILQFWRANADLFTPRWP
jgi:poly(3-hydroxybutyrate) depolymerase